MVEILERKEMTPGDFIKSMRVTLDSKRRSDFDEAIEFSERILGESMVGDFLAIGNKAFNKDIFYRQRLEKLRNLDDENLLEKEDVFARVTLFVDGDVVNLIGLSETWRALNESGELNIFT